MMGRSLLAVALALGVSGPALAEPLALARPTLAMTNRASLLPVMGYAPRVVARADALAAEAGAAAIADPEAADFLDYYESLDDPNVIRAALDVALAKAGSGKGAWEWLTLAEIAIDMALGDHDAAGRPTATPDVFAREAFYDMAAGAALNGFTLAKTGGEAVSALALLARALEAGGDPATAGRVVGYAARVFPGFDGLAYDTDISALLRLAETPPPLPEPPAQDPPSPSLRRGDWLLTCGTGRTCLIQSDLAEISVEIEREAGPGAPVVLRVVLMSAAQGAIGGRRRGGDGPGRRAAALPRGGRPCVAAGRRGDGGHALGRGAPGADRRRARRPSGGRETDRDGGREAGGSLARAPARARPRHG